MQDNTESRECYNANFVVIGDVMAAYGFQWIYVNTYFSWSISTLFH